MGDMNQILYEINEEAAKYYQIELKDIQWEKDISNIDLLGPISEIINRFRIGYSGKEME